ncbi:MAG: hypothetical protein VX874_03565 [Pseudomonadota bacterium]|nr:hypothetical protein [Pseudomonadota bacterium]
MLRVTTLLVMVSMMVWSIVLPVDAQPTSVCPSQNASFETCYQPGAPVPVQAEVSKPCGACALPATLSLPDPVAATVELAVTTQTVRLFGRSVRPERRPPRA